MSGSAAFDTPQEAAHHFAESFQTTASCVCEARFTYPAAHPLDTTRALVLDAGDDVPLGTGLYLYAAHWYTVAQDERSYVVRTGGYAYTINSDNERGELFTWHWHPECASWCLWAHIHAPGDSGDHLPTGRVAFEQIIRWLIQEAHVSPLRSDWDQLLDRNEQDWRARRTWS